MTNLLPSTERGHVNFGWLNSHHSFSFGDYYNPERMGFRSLRVINEDRIEGGTGFPTHPHRDMEIISYVIKGALEHQDSMGNKTRILPGEVQRMSAGTGIRHSEYNASPEEEAHFLQIWILPDKQGYEPSYGQKSFAEELEKNSMVMVVSPSGEKGSISIHQDVRLWISRMKKGQKETLVLLPGRHNWIQMVKGQITVNGQDLKTSDGLALSGEKDLSFQASEDSEFLVFDLA
ncbi:MAG: pirin family protein [Pseudobdellovibrionaceae bacterium]